MANNCFVLVVIACRVLVVVLKKVLSAFSSGKELMTPLLPELLEDRRIVTELFMGEEDEGRVGADRLMVLWLDTAEGDLPVVILVQLILEEIDRSFCLFELGRLFGDERDSGKLVSTMSSCEQAAGDVFLGLVARRESAGLID